jgi:hypothetical protein
MKVYDWERVMQLLLTIPHLLLGRELCLYVDNVSVLYS